MIESKLNWLKSLRGVDVSATQYLVLVTISTYTDKNGLNAHPGWGRLQEDTGLQLNTIKKAVKVLMSKRLLILSEEGGNQHWKGKANVYELAPVLGVRTSETEGVRSGTEGVQSVTGEGVNETHPHQTTNSSRSSQHSESSDSGSTAVERHREQLSPADMSMNDWHDDDGFDEFVTDQLDPIFQSTAWGMASSGVHYKAIGNTIREMGGI